MKIPLVLSSKVSLNKIVVSFVLNMRLCFLKAFSCTLGFIFASAIFEKKILVWISLRKKCLQNQGVWVTQFTTSRAVLYSTSIVMLSEKQLSMFFIYLLFSSQSLSTMKKMAVIKMTPLHKTTYIDSS